jgi:hypothetical protein
METYSFDLKILSLHRQAGRDKRDLPGVRIATPPRRTARGRKNDRLIFFLSFEEPHPFSRDLVNQLLTTMENAYFSTPGSVTSTMRALVEDLNELILKHNLRKASRGEQVAASFSMIVIRGDHLYMSQSGLSHGFLMTAESIEHIYDAQTASQGLGVGRNPQIQFFQTPLADGMLLLITPKVPSGWSATTLQGAFGQPLKVLRRRFLDQAGTDLKAVVLEVGLGRGELELISTSRELEEAISPRTEAPRRGPAQRPPTKPESVSQAGLEPSSPPIITSPVDPGEVQPDAAEVVAEGQPPLTRKVASATGSAVSSALRGFRGMVGRILQGARTFLGRILPGEEMSNIPTSFMAITAVAVPLVVVAVAALVYSRIGRVQQFEYYYTQAEAMSQAALAETDFGKRHTAWENTLALLDIAEEYQTSPESDALREVVSNALDALDEVVRLEFEPAIAGTISNAVKIREMVATDRDLYMLDIESGQVMRASLTGMHYEIDRDFRCGPGLHSSIIVDEIVDIAPLPRSNQEEATIVALDKNGNLLYCIPEKPPQAISLVPPDSLWGDPIAITVENERLYVLDPLTNAVWYYEGGEELKFREAPYFFFTEEVPTLQGAIDLAVDKDVLYLLYNDGHTTTCSYSTMEAAPTSCVDPASYTDSRQGRESGPQIANVLFYQIQHTQPPEPSLYYLDPANRVIYHFSLRLNLVQLYQPTVDFPEGWVTAFAISPTRTVFIAQDYKVYISHLP